MFSFIGGVQKDIVAKAKNIKGMILNRIRGVMLMAETRFSNERAAGYNGKRSSKSSLGGISFLHMLRFAFLVFLSFALVYVYYLYSKDQLQKTILELWTNHQKVIISLSIFITYSAIIFQLGVWKGRRR